MSNYSANMWCMRCSTRHNFILSIYLASKWIVIPETTIKQTNKKSLKGILAWLVGPHRSFWKHLCLQLCTYAGCVWFKHLIPFSTWCFGDELLASTSLFLISYKCNIRLCEWPLLKMKSQGVSKWKAGQYISSLIRHIRQREREAETEISSFFFS